MKTLLIWLAVIVVIGVGIVFYITNSNSSKESPTVEAPTTIIEEDTEDKAEGSMVIIGKSVEGKDIAAYNYGSGDKRILLIGGIHGGYSWNTALLAQEVMDYLESHPEAIPSDIKITVIPVLNPDGLTKAVGTSGVFDKSNVSTSPSVLAASRTNANKVDLSRNFDCNWQSNAVWQSKPISGGTSAFSEPESAAIKAYVESHPVAAAVVWYSAAGGVYSSSCGDDVSSETNALTNSYAKASGYPSHESYDFYATTGDLVNWLAKENIPAISVLLTTHNDTELSKNVQGIEAVIKAYSK